MKSLRDIVLALLLVFVVRTAVAEPFEVPSGSMVPTLLEGDELIAAKYAYGYSRYSLPVGELPDFPGRIFGRAPARGDVVVFRLPRDPSQNYVKRLIGLPGDHIQMKGGRLFINGAAVAEQPIGTGSAVFQGGPHPVTRYIETLPGGVRHEIIKLGTGMPLDDTPEFVVPPKHYFMMGDNRDDSLDSRVSEADGGVGFVPEENLIGRVDRLAFSIDPAHPWWDVFAAFRGSRLLASIR